MPWPARRRLRKKQKRGRTGILLIVKIRENIRSFTDKAGTVSIRENGLELCFRNRITGAPKFVELAPGPHDIEFRVTRTRASNSSSFQKTVDLREDEVLVAVCDPVQPNTFYKKSPKVDSWFLGVLSRRKTR
jgi:hypothetical protein